MDELIQVMPAILIGTGMFAALIHEYDGTDRGNSEAAHPYDDSDRTGDFLIGALLVATGPVGLGYEIYKRYKAERNGHHTNGDLETLDNAPETN